MPEVREVLFTADEIHARVQELAAEIDEWLGGEPVLLLGVLRGCIHFYSDLSRAMKSPCQFDFIQVMSYEGSESTGEVQLVKDLSGGISGKNVLLVEDIYDTGRTLAYLRKMLLNRGPAKLEIAALLDKRERHLEEIDVRFVGFPIPDRFVVGYGLDFDGRYRELPYIGVCSD